MIICGDCREILPTLPANSVQCCVTSPPYWGLRDYGTAQWKGGDVECNHVAPPLGGRGASAMNSGQSHEKWISVLDHTNLYRHICAKCGARRIDSQLGLEATPEEYISKMVTVFREVWRVMRDDGTFWVNLGDSYAGSNAIRWRAGNLLKNGGNSNRDGVGIVPGLKPKDLCGIPWRLAFALQADGWYLRSDIIWHKPNPMPESVTDRPTKAHEYIFLLTKQERYFYDAEAIREPNTLPIRNPGGYCPEKAIGPQNRNGHSQWDKARTSDDAYNPAGRNKRSVWTIATQPYAEAHFATFPEEIPKLCILAGSKPGDTVLDPFAGSGTVGKVALEMGRKPILIELNQEYVHLIKWRTFITPGFF